MKRDMDLIRLILIEIESGKKPEKMARYSEDEILYHCVLAHEAGLIVADVGEGESGQAEAIAIHRLTWAGHDFLDAARDEATWQKAVGKIAKTGGAWTFDLLKGLLSEYLRKSLFE